MNTCVMCVYMCMVYSDGGMNMCDPICHMYMYRYRVLRYFYSTVISVTIMDGVRRYGLRYDDGETENGVCRNNCVFICRSDNVTEVMIERVEKATE